MPAELRCVRPSMRGFGAFEDQESALRLYSSLVPAPIMMIDPFMTAIPDAAAHLGAGSGARAVHPLAAALTAISDIETSKKTQLLRMTALLLSVGPWVWLDILRPGSESGCIEFENVRSARPRRRHHQLPRARLR